MMHPIGASPRAKALACFLQRRAHELREEIGGEPPGRGGRDGHRFVEMLEHVGTVAPYRACASAEQLLRGLPAGEHPEARHTRAARGDGVEPGVADHGALRGRQPDLLNRGHHQIRRRLAPVVRTPRHHDIRVRAEVETGAFQQGVEVGPGAGRGEGGAEPARAGGVEQLDRAGDRPDRVPAHELQEDLDLALSQRLAVAGFRTGAQHVGHEPVAALADLAFDAVGADPVAEILERLGPRCYVGRIAVEECAVNVENQRVQHRPKIGQHWTRIR